MSVVSFAADDLFIARVIKSHASNPDRKWANSYEFRAIDPGTESQLIDLATKLVLFEASVHLNIVTFERILISTWVPDSVPYNPEAFFVSSLTQSGTNGATGEPIGLGQALSVARAAATGRTGHLFYRGALTEANVEAPAGKTILTDRPGVQDTIGDALTASDFGGFIGLTPDNNLQLVMINADASQVRPVLELVAQGVTNLPLDHAWFNRTPAP